MTSINQRAELQNQIWKIANDVRGSVDGWDFKQIADTVSKIEALRADIDKILMEIEG